MAVKPSNKTSLIGPCGMNCSICMAYLREINALVVEDLIFISLLHVLNEKSKPVKYFNKGN